MKKNAADIIILQVYHKPQSNEVLFLRYRTKHIIFCHFLHLEKMYKKPGDIVLHKCTINEDHMVYVAWDTRHNRVFCHLGPFFALYPPNNPKNQNFEKNAWKYYHFTHMHNNNIKKMKINMNVKCENNTMYSSWDMEHDRQHYFSYWTVFCPLPLLITQKIKILKKWKKHQVISSFYTSLP